MELFCDSERGIFAVEAEPLAYSPLFNPYTGEEIPNENLRTEDAKLSDSRTATERDKILERYEAIDRIHRRRLVDLMTGIVSEMTGKASIRATNIRYRTNARINAMSQLSR